MEAPGTGFPVARLAEDLPAVGVREAYLALDADEAAERYAADAAEALRAVAARLGGPFAFSCVMDVSREAARLRRTPRNP